MSGTVHLWTIDLDSGAQSMASLLPYLSGEERARSARLRTTELRQRFVVAHGAVRAILGRYLDLSPETVAVAESDTGKPFLPDHRLAFNLSHSEAVAVCALTLDERIGVDVEEIRTVPDADVLVRRHFAPAEAEAYAAVAAEDRDAAFFSAWTRKEAFVKALGDGVQCPLDRFVVDIAPGVARPHIDPGTVAGTWTLASFEPVPGYVGAVACTGTLTTLQQFHFDEESLRFAPVSMAG